MAVNNGDIYTELSKKYNLHRNIIIQICNHPFIFAARRISDPDDEKAIMMHYLCKIRLKNRLKGRKREEHDKNESKTMHLKRGRRSI